MYYTVYFFQKYVLWNEASVLLPLYTCCGYKN